MKKFLSVFFTVVFALACNYFSKTLLFDILSARFPQYLVQIMMTFAVILLSIIWICLILRIKLRTFKMAKQRIKWIWVLSAFLIPALYSLVSVFYSSGFRFSEFDYAQFALNILLPLTAGTIINEITFRSLILSSFESAFSKLLSSFLTAFIFAAVSVQDFNCEIIMLLQQMTVPFVFSLLLCFVALHSESITNGIIISIIYRIFFTLSNEGIISFKSQLSTWKEIAVEVAILTVFIIIAVILLVKKRKEEVLYW